MREILQLCKYILYIAVCCPDNSEYIQKITQLSSESQEYIMHFIDETMRYNKDDPIEPQQSSDPYSSHNAYGDDGAYRAQSELARISQEKEELEIQYKQLIDKHSELLTKYVCILFSFVIYLLLTVYNRIELRMKNKIYKQD